MAIARVYSSVDYRIMPGAERINACKGPQLFTAEARFGILADSAIFFHISPLLHTFTLSKVSFVAGQARFAEIYRQNNDLAHELKVAA